MKKAPLLLLTVALSLFALSSALAGHDHIDSGEGYIMHNSYVAPTETQDGTTGPGTCSVCGAVVEPAVRIPSNGSQRTVAGTPVPTSVPTAAPTPVLTAVPTAAPTAVPTAAPTPVPTAAPTAVPTPPPAADSGTSGSAYETAVPTRVPDPGTGSGTSVSATPVPTRVSAPAQTAAPTAVPTAVTLSTSSQGSSGSAQITAQPDLTQVVSPAQSGTSTDSAGSTSSAGSSGGIRLGGSSRSSVLRAGSGRDLSLYPIFSNKFPWRRLRMNPQPGIIVRYAGQLLWPVPEASSPLQRLLQP